MIYFKAQTSQNIKENKKMNKCERCMKTRDTNLMTVKLELNRAAKKSAFNKDEQRV